MGVESVADVVHDAVRRGPRPRTNARAIAVVGLRLFAERGFHETTIDQIAAAAQVSRTTFFRYFDAKADLLWNDFNSEADALRASLAAAPSDLPTMEAVRRAVLAINGYQPEHIAELRARTSLLSSVPELAASATAHYNGWISAISEFVAHRAGLPVEALVPMAVGRATLAVCSVAYEQWARTDDTDLIPYLDRALRALADGFADPPVVSADAGPSSSGSGASTRRRQP